MLLNYIAQHQTEDYLSHCNKVIRHLLMWVPPTNIHQIVCHSHDVWYWAFLLLLSLHVTKVSKLCTTPLTSDIPKTLATNLVTSTSFPCSRRINLATSVSSMDVTSRQLQYLIQAVSITLVHKIISAVRTWLSLLWMQPFAAGSTIEMKWSHSNKIIV